MSGKKFRALKWIAIVVVLFVAVILALPFFLNANQFRPQLESKLSGALGREVKVGNLKLSLLSGGVAVDDIAIGDNPAFSSSPFVTAKSLKVGIELKSLIFSKKVQVTAISLDRPAINLVRSPSGAWNFSDLGSPAGGSSMRPDGNSGRLSGADVSIKEIKITHGRVTVTEGAKKPSVYDDVNIVVSDLSVASSFPFTLTATLPGGGTLKLDGKAGPLNQTDNFLTPLSAELAITHFDLVASGFVPPGSGLAGFFDFRGTITSDGRQAKNKGHATAEKFQLVKSGSPAGQPVLLDYSVDHDLAHQRGVLSDATIGYGKAIARVNGNYERRGDSLVLKMKLRGTNMPMQDLAALLPAFGVTLPKGASLQGGTLNTDLNAEGPIDGMVIAGTADISKTRLVGFDLAGKMAALATLAGLQSNRETEIEKFASSVRLTPEGTEVKNLLLVMPALGELSGAGKVAADQSLDFAMQAILKPAGSIGAGLERLVKRNSLNVSFFVRGKASDPKFIPDVAKTSGSLLDSVLSGRGSNEKQTKTGDALGGALRDLLKKKK